MSSEKKPGYFDELTSEEDVARLRQSHIVVKHAMNNRLVYAPVDFTGESLRIVDACTADGYWLLDLHKDVPNSDMHAFFGFDIDGTRFPKDVPEGVTLQVQDVNGPFPPDWPGSFDLVHQRFGISSSGPDPHGVCKSLLSLVKPGGWVQFVEPEFRLLDDSAPLTARQYMALVRELQTFVGVLDAALKIPDWVKDAGFVGIEIAPLKTPLGATVPDPRLQKLSIDSVVAAIEGMVTKVKGSSG
jgi:SAM-dependent methyltransferase